MPSTTTTTATTTTPPNSPSHHHQGITTTTTTTSSSAASFQMAPVSLPPRAPTSPPSAFATFFSAHLTPSQSFSPSTHSSTALTPPAPYSPPFGNASFSRSLGLKASSSSLSSLSLSTSPPPSRPSSPMTLKSPTTPKSSSPTSYDPISSPSGSSLPSGGDANRQAPVSSSPTRASPFSSTGGLLSLKGWGTSKSSQRFVSLRSRVDGAGLPLTPPASNALNSAPLLSSATSGELALSSPAKTAAQFETLVERDAGDAASLGSSASKLPLPLLIAPLEPVPATLLALSNVDFADDADSDDDSDIEDLYRFAVGSLSTDSLSSVASDATTTANEEPYARTRHRLWSASTSSSSLSADSTIAPESPPYLGPLDPSVSSVSSGKVSNTSTFSTTVSDLKTTRSSLYTSLPSPVERAQPEREYSPPQYLKPILRRESCPENLDQIGSDNQNPKRAASQPQLNRSDSAKSLTFREKLEQICLFSATDSPAQIALAPQTEFFLGSESDSDVDAETETETVRAPSPQEDLLTKLQPWRILSLTSPTTQKLSSGANLAVDYIRLEDGQQKKLVVSILVRNIAFEKRVTVRYTTDGWKTVPSREADAMFSATISATMGGVIGIDRFIATVDLEREAAVAGGDSNPAEELFFELAVRAELAGGSFWDSNSGLNHRAHLKRTRRVVSPASGSSKPSKSRTSLFGEEGVSSESPLSRSSSASSATAEALARANAAIAAAEAARIARDFDEQHRRCNSTSSDMPKHDASATYGVPRRANSFDAYGRSPVPAAAPLPMASPLASSTVVRISISTSTSTMTKTMTSSPVTNSPTTNLPFRPATDWSSSRSLTGNRPSHKLLSLPPVPNSSAKSLMPILETPPLPPALDRRSATDLPTVYFNPTARPLLSHSSDFDRRSVASVETLVDGDATAPTASTAARRQRSRYSVEVMESISNRGPSLPHPPATVPIAPPQSLVGASRRGRSSEDIEMPLSSWSSGLWSASSYGNLNSPERESATPYSSGRTANMWHR